MRRSGGLPAISAALMAPIETPVTQSGANPASDKRLVHARLVRAERATALQHQQRVIVAIAIRRSGGGGKALDHGMRDWPSA